MTTKQGGEKGMTPMGGLVRSGVVDSREKEGSHTMSAQLCARRRNRRNANDNTK